MISFLEKITGNTVKSINENLINDWDHPWYWGSIEEILNIKYTWKDKIIHDLIAKLHTYTNEFWGI